MIIKAFSFIHSPEINTPFASIVDLCRFYLHTMTNYAHFLRRSVGVMLLVLLVLRTLIYVPSVRVHDHFMLAGQGSASGMYCKKEKKVYN